MFTFTSRWNSSTLFAYLSASSLLVETKNPLQIPSGARGPYSGGIQHYLLNPSQHGNSLAELITEFVDMVIKREFVINCDTYKSFCELSCLSSVAFNLTCNCLLFILFSIHLLVASIAFVLVLLRITLLFFDHFCDLSKSDWRTSLVAWGATQ